MCRGGASRGGGGAVTKQQAIRAMEIVEGTKFYSSFEIEGDTMYGILPSGARRKVEFPESARGYALGGGEDNRLTWNISVSRETERAIQVTTTITRKRTGVTTEEQAWFPKSQSMIIKNTIIAPKWLMDRNTSLAAARKPLDFIKWR